MSSRIDEGYFSAQITLSSRSTTTSASGGFAALMGESIAKIEEEEQAAQSAAASASILATPFLGGALGDCTISIKDIQEEGARRWAEFQDNYQSLLDEYGISSEPPFGLILDGQGQLNLIGEHPQSYEIKKMLAENPELAQEYNAVTAIGQFLSAAKESIEFQKAYAQDPYEALRRFAYLFEEMPGGSGDNCKPNRSGGASILQTGPEGCTMQLERHNSLAIFSPGFFEE